MDVRSLWTSEVYDNLVQKVLRIMARVAFIFLITFFLWPNALPVSANDAAPLFGMHITEASGEDYITAFQKAKAHGIQATTMSLAWDDLEPHKGKYNLKLLKIANSFYPPRNIVIALTITPIDTNRNRLPNYLKGRLFDDPILISRFKKLLDHVFATIPDLKLSVFAIGNEIDIYLGKKRKHWNAYTRFLKAVIPYAKQKRTKMAVGTKVTFYGLTHGLTKRKLRGIHKLTDAVLVTYYPLNADFTVRSPNTIESDYKKIIANAQGLPVHIIEIGYPTSKVNKGSEEKQAQFVYLSMLHGFNMRAHIKSLYFLWFTDLESKAVKTYENYYGVRQNKSFAEFLRTLGLRTYQGRSKPALKLIKKAAQDWGRLKKE